MTALTIAQNAANRIKIPTPAALFGSSDDQAILLRNLMNEEGKTLAGGGEASDHPWTVLITEKTFNGVAAAIQTSAVPSDFNYIINESMWNRTRKWRCTGPLDSKEWQYLQAIPSANVYPYFRFQGGNLLIYPSPTAGDTFAYEYVSKNWTQTSSGTGIAAMTADTDVSLIDDEILTRGVVWRFLASKGLDYAEAFRKYEIYLAKAVARDGGKKRLNLGGRDERRFVGNVPEGSWNV